MKATSIQTGKTYEVKTGRNTTAVRVESFNPRTGGWMCATKGGKSISIKDTARFVREIAVKKNAPKTGQAKGGNPQGQMSGIDAAYRVLRESGCPMRVREITETALQNGYCDLKGATPELTISAALQREIARKQDAARFVKIEKGLFVAR